MTQKQKEEKDEAVLTINLPEPKQRRIVKAAHPPKKAVESSSSDGTSADAAARSPQNNYGGSSSNTNLSNLNADAEDIKEDRFDSSTGGGGNARSLPQKIADSPSVAREIEQEKVESLKKLTIQSATDRQKQRRDKNKQERRFQSQQQQPGDAAGGGGVDTTTSTSSTIQPNPFSRFLSVFSVEPQHPEHKRTHEDDQPPLVANQDSYNTTDGEDTDGGTGNDNDDDDQDLQPPVGKKMRSGSKHALESKSSSPPAVAVGGTDEVNKAEKKKDDDDASGAGAKCPFGLVLSNPTVTAAVAVAAVAILMMVRWNKK